MTKKYPRKGDCFDCGTNVPGIKVTAYSYGKDSKGAEKIGNGCGECGETWTEVPNRDRKRFTVNGFRGN